MGFGRQIDLHGGKTMERHFVPEIQTQSGTDRGPKMEPGGPLHERVKDREKPPMPTEKVSSGKKNLKLLRAVLLAPALSQVWIIKK